jgi:hypothetical protein
MESTVVSGVKMAYGVIVSCLRAQARHRSSSRINGLNGVGHPMLD